MVRFDKYVSSHAEFLAIVKVKNKELLNGATIVVYREDKNGVISMCRPCEMCQKILKHYGIKKVVYTTYEGFFEERVA